jgi:hypothetical protein
MTTERQMIEVPAGQVSAELHRRGFNDDEPVRVTIEPEQELFPGAESRAGWSSPPVLRMRTSTA